MTKNEQRQRIGQYSIQLFSLMGIAFGFHWLVLFFIGVKHREALLFQTYSANLLLAWTIVVLIIRFQKVVKNQIGFLFLAGSTLKIAVFFVLFRPLFLLDGQISAVETTGFIIPYLIALFIETGSLVRFLRT